MAPIQKKLPEEVMTLVLERLAPYQLGRAQTVCKQWHELGSTDALWRSACSEAFQNEDRETTAKLLKRHYRWGDARLAEYVSLHVEGSCRMATTEHCERIR